MARIAGRQHGNVTSRQLLDAGLSEQGVRRRVQKGTLHCQHRGVYRVGHRAPSLEARYMAAVLACGEGAALSGAAAAYLYGLIKQSVPPPEVTTTANRRVRGVTVHRVRRLEARDATNWWGIPITTVARTVVDLAADLPLSALARACHEAGVRYRLKAKAVDQILERKRNATGAKKLRQIFHGDFRTTLSKLERAFLKLLRSNDLSLPHTNRKIEDRYVDCRWPDHRLTIELDSYTYHHTRHAWEQDRRREREARARGDEFRRYTYGDVTEDQHWVLAELRELLTVTALTLPASRTG